MCSPTHGGFGQEIPTVVTLTTSSGRWFEPSRGSQTKSAFVRRRIFVCIIHFSLFTIHYSLFTIHLLQADFEWIINNEVASLMNYGFAMWNTPSERDRFPVWEIYFISHCDNGAMLVCVRIGSSRMSTPTEVGMRLKAGARNAHYGVVELGFSVMLMFLNCGTSKVPSPTSLCWFYWDCREAD